MILRRRKLGHYFPYTLLEIKCESASLNITLSIDTIRVMD